MKKVILVLDDDPTTEEALGRLLEGEFFHITLVSTLAACEDYLKAHNCNALILDLDTVALDNRDIRRLKRGYPELYIFAKSERKFHPDLEEAMRNYIFACLTKPLDTDELLYLLKSLPESHQRE